MTSGSTKALPSTSPAIVYRSSRISSLINQRKYSKLLSPTSENTSKVDTKKMKETMPRIQLDYRFMILKRPIPSLMALPMRREQL